MSPTSKTWQHLKSLASDADSISIAEQLVTPNRMENYSFNLGGLYVDLSRHKVTDEILGLLLILAEESGVLTRAREMASGKPVNISENRPALHLGLRSPAAQLPQLFIDEVRDQQLRMAGLSQQIRSGAWLGSTNERITDIINIGIGGSDLGPKMVVRALREYHDGPKIHFISNVDGAEIHTLLGTLDASSTAIIISSKTFTTTETLLNASTALSWLSSELGLDHPENSSHCFAVTADYEQALGFGIPENQILTFPETIGGRYSLWSTIGFSVCIAIGMNHFEALLAGAAQADRHFLETPPNKNIPLLMGMFGIWYNNFLGAQTQAVIPYCERLDLFINHLQQLDMESNGKSRTLDGQTVQDQTGPIIWGQTGTNGQHAFFQLLHQGTKPVPVDFIGTIHDELSDPTHHRVLLANMIAQSEALMTGQQNTDPHRQYPGNRPSSTLLLEQLNPESLGMLIALYEHKVFVQGTVWAINSFDQWGVELGKHLTDKILDGSTNHDPSTTALLKKTGLPD